MKLLLKTCCCKGESIGSLQTVDSAILGNGVVLRSLIIMCVAIPIYVGACFAPGYGFGQERFSLRIS